MEPLKVRNRFLTAKVNGILSAMAKGILLIELWLVKATSSRLFVDMII